MKSTSNSIRSRKTRSPEEEIIDKQIGKRIAKRCDDLGITSEQLANTLGLKTPTITSYRTGDKTLKAYRIDDMCKALRCDANYLINGNHDVKRATGLSENACRMLTYIDITDSDAEIETSQGSAYTIPKIVNENDEAFDTRSREALREIQGALSWLIEHGFLEVLAEMVAIRSDWNESKTLRLKTFQQATESYLNYPTADEEKAITETNRVEKLMQILIEHYVSERR